MFDAGAKKCGVVFVLVVSVSSTVVEGQCFSDGCSGQWSSGGTQYVISGGPSSGDPLSSDDQLNICVNNQRVYCDSNIYAGNNGAVSFMASPGDMVKITTYDYFGSCRSRSAIWVHSGDGCSKKIADARNDGCAGYPQKLLFDTQTFALPDWRTFDGNGDGALDCREASLTATLTADDSDVSPEEEFEIRLTVANGSSGTVNNVMPDGVLTLVPSGNTKGTTLVEQLSGPEPASVGALEPGTSTVFVYRFKAREVGSLVIVEQAVGQQNGDTVTSNASATNSIYIRGLEVDDLAVVQSVYDADLIADKPTAVRAKLRSGFDTPQQVTIQLNVDDGQSPFVLNQMLELAPGETEKVFWADQPFRVAGSGKATLTIDPEHALTADAERKKDEVTFTTQVVRPLSMVLKRVAVANFCADKFDPPINLPAPGEELLPTAAEVHSFSVELDHYLTALFPLPAVNLAVDPEVFLFTPEQRTAQRTGLPIVMACEDQLSEIHVQMSRLAKRTPFDRFLGLLPHKAVPRDVSSLWNETGITGALGETYKGSSGMIVAAFDRLIRLTNTLNSLPAVTAHELGHTFGLPFFSNQASVFAPEEYGSGIQGRPASDGVWIDPGKTFFTEGFAETRESTCPPLCNFMASSDSISAVVQNGKPAVWANAEDYRHLLSRLSSGSRDPLVVMVSGLIGKDGTVITYPWHTFMTDEVSEETDPNGPYAIVILDQNGLPLKTFHFNLDFVKARNPVPEEGGFAPFVFNIELPAATAKIAVTHDAETLVERAKSAHAPQVTISAPAGGESLNPGQALTIAWQGSDADGDALTYNVFFSDDDGARWFPLKLDLAATTSDWTVPDLRTDFARIRVEACDGMNMGEATSGRFSILGSGGALTASAGPDREATVGQQVTLDGSISRDPNSKSLTYRWRITGIPDGGGTSLTSETGVQTAFTPPVEGRYLVELIVNNGETDSKPGYILLTARTSDPGGDGSSVIPPAAACGAGTCGAGTVTIAPVALLMLLGGRVRRRR